MSDFDPRFAAHGFANPRQLKAELDLIPVEYKFITDFALTLFNVSSTTQKQFGDYAGSYSGTLLEFTVDLEQDEVALIDMTAATAGGLLIDGHVYFKIDGDFESRFASVYGTYNPFSLQALIENKAGRIEVEVWGAGASSGRQVQCNNPVFTVLVGKKITES